MTPDKFRWAAKDFGYARRAAWYMDLATAATGELVDRYVFVPVSKDGPAAEGAPHPIEVYELEPDWIAGARPLPAWFGVPHSVWWVEAGVVLALLALRRALRGVPPR